MQWQFMLAAPIFMDTGRFFILIFTTNIPLQAFSILTPSWPLLCWHGMRRVLPVLLSGTLFVVFCCSGFWRYFLLRDSHTSWKLIIFCVGRLIVLLASLYWLTSNYSVQVLRLFRVDEAHEIEGLDVVKHNEPAYPIGKDTNDSISSSWFNTNLSRC